MDTLDIIPILEPTITRVPKRTRDSITQAILQDLDPRNALKLTECVAEPIYHGTGFSEERLIDLCRLIALGQAEENACQAIGLPAETLKRWKDQIPDVKAEINRARHLANAAVMSLFRSMMTCSDPKIALDAMKFFLSRRSKEFREKMDIEVEIDLEKLQKKVREDLYGQRETKPALLNAPDSPAALGADL